MGGTLGKEAPPSGQGSNSQRAQETSTSTSTSTSPWSLRLICSACTERRRKEEEQEEKKQQLLQQQQQRGGGVAAKAGTSSGSSCDGKNSSVVAAVAVPHIPVPAVALPDIDGVQAMTARTPRSAREVAESGRQHESAPAGVATEEAASFDDDTSAEVLPSPSCAPPEPEFDATPDLSAAAAATAAAATAAAATAATATAATAAPSAAMEAAASAAAESVQPSTSLSSTSSSSSSSSSESSDSSQGLEIIAGASLQNSCSLPLREQLLQEQQLQQQRPRPRFEVDREHDLPNQVQAAGARTRTLQPRQGGVGEADPQADFTPKEGRRVSASTISLLSGVSENADENAETPRSVGRWFDTSEHPREQFKVKRRSLGAWWADGLPIPDCRTANTEEFWLNSSRRGTKENLLSPTVVEETMSQVASIQLMDSSSAQSKPSGSMSSANSANSAALAARRAAERPEEEETEQPEGPLQANLFSATSTTLSATTTVVAPTARWLEARGVESEATPIPSTASSRGS